MATATSSDGPVTAKQTAVRPTRKRNNSSLGADPRGDTGAGALATANLGDEKMADRKARSPPPKDRTRGRKRRKAKNAWHRVKRTCLKHTWLLPLVMVLVLLSLYFISPGEHNPLHCAIFLSYANPPFNERTNTLPPHIGNVTQYGKGPKDIAFVAFYTIVLSFTREFLMQRMIKPLGIRWGIRGRNKMSRFMEQFYTAVYFAIFGPLGLYVMSRTPVWYFNTAGMFEGFPHRAHDAWFKTWYLLEGAYWAQQFIVLMLQLEKPRKDFRELQLHHVITLALIGLSYRFHFTYMGVAVYITHDISDFFLATSKILNYVDSMFTPPYFVTFIGVWAYLRHFINLKILYALFPYNLGLPGNNLFATVGRYDLSWPEQQYKCWISQAITFSLLAALQAVNIFWFVLILRILYRFLFQGVAKDERSDDEDEYEEAEEEDASAAASKESSSANPAVQVNGKFIDEQVRLLPSVPAGGDADFSGSEAGSGPVRRSPRKHR